MILRKLFPFEVIQSISTDNYFKLITFRVIDFKEWISRDTNQLSKFKNRDTQLTTKLEFIDGILIFLFSERLIKMGKRPKPPSQNGGSQVDCWQPGNVIRLQMKNFMCVNRVEYNFHPKLNWIIGMVSFEVIYGA